MKTEENARDKVDNITKPSPRKLKLSSNPFKLTRTTPPKPIMHAITFRKLSFSMRNMRLATSIEKKALEPLKMAPLTPLVLARPT